MSDITVTKDIHILVQEGNAALLAGDAYVARQRFRSALDIDPHHVEALAGLAGSVRPYAEKREYLRRALQADPGNAELIASLAVVEEKLATGEVLAPRGVQAVEPTLSAQPALPSPEVIAPPTTPSVALHCYNHPNRETGLRCTNCNRPICADCVRPAPVGQLCPECAKARRPVNYQIGVPILAACGLVSFIVGAVLSFLIIFFLTPIPFFSFIVGALLGPVVADLYVRLLDRLTRSKRGRELQLTVGIALGLGAAPLTIVFLGLWTILLILLVMGTVIGRVMFQLR
jgi:tetratricopeptide (TPR) repeat protein